MKNIVTTLIAILIFSVAVKAGPIERVKNGFGATLTATTTNQELVIRQIPNDDIVSNGTFAAANAWTTNTGWFITGGKLVFTADAALTNTAYQVCAVLENDTVYKVTYTVAGIDPTTNRVAVVMGTSTGTVRTADGTYTENIYQFGASNITFRAASDAAGGLTIDNVVVRKLADIAYVQNIQMEVLATDVPVYFILNGTDRYMTNAYAVSQCLITGSNQVFRIDESSDNKITGIWYRTASGSATATFNGN